MNNLQQQALKAFIDIMDGLRAEDLMYITGLSVERCEEIVTIYKNLNL